VVEPVETTGDRVVEPVETTGDRVVELVETTVLRGPAVRRSGGSKTVGGRR